VPGHLFSVIVPDLASVLSVLLLSSFIPVTAVFALDARFRDFCKIASRIVPFVGQDH